MAEHQKKTFTADKLNWLDCVANDRDLKPAAFKVAYAIMQHVNAETLIAWLSDETLVDMTGYFEIAGSATPRKSQRGRMAHMGTHADCEPLHPAF